MRKTTMLIAMVFMAAALLTGCWNYRGLNEMAITAGVAVDRDPKTGLYHMSLEIIDLSGPVKEQGIKAKLIESYGVTLFDAVRNTKKRTVNKVYFGHMELVIFSDEVARSMDMSSLIDFFLRDAECRETMCVAISQEPAAKDLLSIEGIGQPVVAFEIRKIIQEDNKVTSSTPVIEMYEIYNTLNAQGIELALPALHNTINDGEPTSEANGTAVFKNQRLVGYLSPEETKYFLFATNKVEGGVITCASTGEGPEDTTLEISKNKGTMSFDYKDGQISVTVETETDTYLNEIDQPMDALDLASIKMVENSASQKVMRGISDVIEHVRTAYNADIFGFGNMIYKNDQKLWQQLADKWDEVFPALTVNVKCKVNIVNAASFKQS